MQDSEKQVSLFLVGYGGHKSTIKELEKYMRYQSKDGINEDSSAINFFSFLENFLIDPINIDGEPKGKVYCPYLERMVREQQFLPDWKSIRNDCVFKKEEIIQKLVNVDFPRIPKSRESEKEYIKEDNIVDFKFAKFGNNIFEQWKNNDGLSEYIIDNYSKTDFCEEIYDYNKKWTQEQDSVKASIKEKLLSIYPLLKNDSFDDIPLKVMGYPIASNKLFYGYLLFSFFSSIVLTTDEKKAKLLNVTDITFKELTDSGDKIKSISSIFDNKINEYYLPSLILCHHSHYEKACHDGKRIVDKIPFVEENVKNSNDIIEKSISELWKSRIKNCDKIWHNGNNDHFIFKDRFWGSPKTIKELMELFRGDSSKDVLEKGKRIVKTFLIYGGPGSGKDSTAKMVGLFSKHFRFSKQYIFNMAALKPDWLAPPSISGLQIEHDSPKKEYILGIFEKVILDAIIKKENPIIILDELNSLDIDAQGTLLRVLENLEIIPIGGIQERKEITNELKINEFAILVIGVVNEQCPQLTLSSSIERTKSKEMWGDLFGPALYEYYRKMRRLRDDLFFRFRRGGYINLPNLNERREDIPIMFYENLPDNYKKDIAAKNIFIEYDVWEKLTNENIDWKGNVRQLQTFVQHLVRNIEMKKVKSGNQNIEIEINVPLIEKVLNEMKII